MNSIPGEVDTVVRDAVHPRGHCEGDANLPSELEKQYDGLDSPINEPRTSHMLLTEPNVPTTTERAGQLFAVVRADPVTRLRTLRHRSKFSSAAGKSKRII